MRQPHQARAGLRRGLWRCACLARLGICTTIDPQAAGWVETLLFSTFAQLGEIEAYPEIQLLDLAHMWVREHAGFDLRSIAFLKTLLMG